MKSLHIALVSPFFPLKGGISRFSGELREALLERGYRVSAISFRRLYPRFLLGGKPVYEPGAPESGALPLIDVLNPLTWVSTARRIRRLKPDIMICAYWTGILAPLYLLLQRLSGSRLIVLMHNFSSHERLAGESLLRDRFLSAAAGVAVLSDHVARQVSEAYPGARVGTFFHPVYRMGGDVVAREEARVSLGIREDGPLLLFFGYVRRYKGLDILFEAMPAVLNRYPEAMLAVAGEFHCNEGEFRRQVVRLGVADRVRFFPGFVSAERAPLFFAAADAVVLPYREASQSGVVEQAYGFGLPVIVTAAGGLAGQVRDGLTGIVAPEAEAGALASGICRFLAGRGTIPYSQHVEAFARERSWTVFAESIGAFAEEVAV